MGKENLFIQKAYKRESEEISETSRIHDSAPYRTESFMLEEVSENEWRVYPAGDEVVPGSSRQHNSESVLVPLFLAKIIRNSIIAQNRAHSGVYRFHNTADVDLPLYDLDEDVKEARAQVSVFMREMSCHKLATVVLQSALNPDGTGSLTKQNDPELEEKFLASEGYDVVKILGHAGPRKRRDETCYQRVSNLLSKKKEECPLIVRIAKSHPEKGLSADLLHSFIVLGVTDTGEAICFEKVGFESLPFRITYLRAVVEEYENERSDVEWQVASVKHVLQEIYD